MFAQRYVERIEREGVNPDGGKDPTKQIGGTVNLCQPCASKASPIPSLRVILHQNQ